MERNQSIVLGTSSLGAGTACGSADETMAIETATALFTGPFARIDTSNVYAEGRSEEVLGEARRQLADPDAGASIITKVDADPISGALDRDRVLRSYEESVRRLGVDRVPLLHLHDPYTITFEEASAPGGAIEGMVELRDSGAVDAIGVAAGPISLLLDYVRTGAFDAVLTHNRYTLVDRTALPLLEEAQSRNLAVFNAAPFGAGILAAGVRPDARYGYRPAPEPVIAWVGQAQRICDGFGVSLRAAALHFSLRSPLVDATVVGVTCPQRLRQLETLVETRIPEDLWTELDAIGATPDPLEGL
jgi:D-threo-aldose 1-dehydrogenase